MTEPLSAPHLRVGAAAGLWQLVGVGLSLTLAGAALVATVLLYADFPAGPASLPWLLVGYGLACAVSAYSWLLLLPLLLVCYDLTPWTGRAGLNELDMLLLLTLGWGWLRAGINGLSAWRAKRSGPPSQRRHSAISPPAAFGPPASRLSHPLLLLFWCGYVLILTGSAWPGGGIPSGALWGLVYYAPQVELLQQRGLFYAMLLFFLWLPLYRHHAEKAERYLLLGGCLAALALALVLTWERGVFADLLADGSYYARLRSLLDFSSSYRVTGVLASMHTGGEALDGMLIIFLALALAAVVHLSGWQRVLAMSAFLGASYGLVATFTRTTYVSYGVLLLLFAGLVLYQRRPTLQQLAIWDWLALGGVCVALLLLRTVYQLSGLLGVLSATLMLLAGVMAAAIPLLQARRRYLLVAVCLVLLLLGLYAYGSSKWVDFSPRGLLTQTFILLFAGGVGGLLSTRTWLASGSMVSLFSALMVVALLLTIAVGGNRMTTRIAAVDDDLVKRTEHWQAVLQSMAQDPTTRLLGMGRGSFPAAYALQHPEKVLPVGGARIVTAGEQKFLRLSRGEDLTVAQRVTLRSGQNYRVSLRTRTERASALVLGFCERNIIFTGDEGGHCSSQWYRLPASDGAWHSQQLEIDSHRLGAGAIWQRWPTVFYLKNPGKIDIDIDAISVTPAALRFNLVANGDFGAGMDYWYTYNDNKHLPWHIKNLFLALWYEGGALGCALTLSLLYAGLRNAVHGSVQGHGVALAGGLVLVGVLVIGVMGNPLDSVRVALLFYWLAMVLAFSHQR